jgi:uncharacterized protein
MVYQIKRIVITGNPGAGKSTLIRSVSEIQTIETEKTATDKIKSLKAKTTVGMDFGRVQLDSKLVLHLYGTPGQSRFDFMWDVLISTADAYILLVSAHSPQEFSNARQISNFMNQRVKIPTIVGLTHMDCPGAVSPERIAIAIGYPDRSKRPPFVTLNANEPESIKKALNALIKHLNQVENQKSIFQYLSA